MQSYRDQLALILFEQPYMQYNIAYLHAVPHLQAH